MCLLLLFLLLRLSTLQVVGSLTAGNQFDDEDDSIDDDTATDGGEVSRAGSDLSDAGVLGLVAAQTVTIVLASWFGTLEISVFGPGSA